MPQPHEVFLGETQIIETTVAYPLNSSIVQKASEILFIDIDNPQERMKELLDYCDESQTPLVDLMVNGLLYGEDQVEGLEADEVYEKRSEAFVRGAIENPLMKKRFMSQLFSTVIPPDYIDLDARYLVYLWLIEASDCQEFSPVLQRDLEEMDDKITNGNWEDSHMEAYNRLVDVLAKIDKPLAVKHLKERASRPIKDYMPVGSLEKLAKIDPAEAETLLLSWYGRAANDGGRLTIANLLADIGNIEKVDDLVSLTQGLLQRLGKEEKKDSDSQNMLKKSLEVLAKMKYPQTEDLVFQAIDCVNPTEADDLVKILRYNGDEKTLIRLSDYYSALAEEINKDGNNEQKKKLQWKVRTGVPSVINGVLVRMSSQDRISLLNNLVSHPVFEYSGWRLMMLETAAYSPNLAPISNDTDFVNEVKSIILNNLSRLSNQEKRTLGKAISANASLAHELSQLVFDPDDMQMINFSTNILSNPRRTDLETERKIRNQLISWAESDNTTAQRRAIKALGERGYRGDHQAIQYLVQKLNQIERFDDDTLVGVNLYVFKALRSLADRFSNRFLFGHLMKTDNSVAVRKLIVRSLVERGFFDKKMLELFRAAHMPDEERKYLNALNILNEQGALPTYETVKKLALGEQSVEQMTARVAGLPGRIEDIINDPYSLELWFSFLQPSHQFDNLFSLIAFRNIVKTVSDPKRIINENDKVLHKMEQAWEKAGVDVEECKRIWLEGVAPQRFIIVGKGGEDLITRKKMIQHTLEKLTRQVADLIPIAHLAGRIKGLTKGDVEVSNKVSSILSEVNILGAMPEGIRGIHKHLFSLFDEIENPKKDTEDQQSLYDQDRDLFIKLLQEKGFLDENYLLDVNKEPEDLMQAMEESLLKQLTTIEKRWRREPEAQHFAMHLNSLYLAFVRNEEEYLNNQIIPQAQVRAEFVPKNEPILFWRIGDARETCTSTSGGDDLTIAGLYHDVSSVGFIITDSTNNRAIGHIRCQAGQDENGENVLLVGGYYIKPDYPFSSVAQAITTYIEQFAKRAGMKDVFLANDQYSDTKASGYTMEERKLVRLQGVKVVYDTDDPEDSANDVYSDFPASTEKLEKVHCFVKVKK